LPILPHLTVFVVGGGAVHRGPANRAGHQL